MANLSRGWGRPSMLSLQRDVEDLLEDYEMPRSFRREIDRVFDLSRSPDAIWRDMDRILGEFETPRALSTRLARLFEAFGLMGRRRGGERYARELFVPEVDVAERDNELVLKVDLPGMREKDIELRVEDGNTLTISGERREEESRNVRGYQYQERRYGSFSRSIPLPSGVDASNIAADFRNGVLEIHVPRSEGSRARRIPVMTGAGRDEPRAYAGGNGPNATPGQSISAS